MIDKRPLLIVMCAGVADVVAAVNFVREHELPVAVRGGGHNVSGTGVCDDGVVIDLSFMRGVRVDPGAAHRLGPGRLHVGATSTGRRSRSASRSPAGSSRRRASPGSRSRAGTRTSAERTA